MTQTYRTDDLTKWGTGKGSDLAPAEVDINFWDIIARLITQEARPDPGPVITSFSVTGTQFYVHFSDSSALGPYQLPVAAFNDTGEWLPSTHYSVNDIFTINGGLYHVIFDHISGTGFDPNANDGSGHDYYSLWVQTPGSSLPSGGVVGQVVTKSTTTDYAVAWSYKTATGGATGEVLKKNSATQDDTVWGSLDAADVSFTPAGGSSLTADNVQDAIDELEAAGGGGGGGIISQNSRSAAYTTVLADAGKQIFHPSADTTARTFTIDSNANVAYLVGTAITFVNQNAAGVITIAITADTMRLAGAGSTGSRTLAANGVATALKLTSTEWIISGTGLT